jgi:hypothetical protein
MRLALQGEAVRNIVRGGSGLSAASKRATRLVAGLPEGYYEAFATLYRDYADILTARRNGTAPDPLALLAPTVEDGVRGVAFVEARCNPAQGAPRAARGGTARRGLLGQEIEPVEIGRSDRERRRQTARSAR